MSTIHHVMGDVMEYEKQKKAGLMKVGKKRKKEGTVELKIKQWDPNTGKQVDDIVKKVNISGLKQIQEGLQHQVDAIQVFLDDVE